MPRTASSSAGPSGPGGVEALDRGGGIARRQIDLGLGDRQPTGHQPRKVPPSGGFAVACDSLAGPFEATAVDEARCLREALRQHLAGPAATAATGGTDAAATALEPAVRDVCLGVIFADGQPSLTARGRGWPLLRGRLMLLLTQVSSDGHWDRLRICPGEQCAWAFYDRSKNRSRTWCSEQVCGARTRSRTYRRRRRDRTD